MFFLQRALSQGSRGTALTPAPAQVVQLNDLYGAGWAGGAAWGVLTASCAVPVPKPRAPQGQATPSLVHCVPLRNVSDFSFRPFAGFTIPVSVLQFFALKT